MLLIYFSIAKKCRHCGNLPHSEEKLPLCKSFVQSLEGRPHGVMLSFSNRISIWEISVLLMLSVTAILLGRKILLTFR